jgi:hypothetical protein
MKIGLNSVLESADTVLAEVRTHAPGPPGKLDITPDMLPAVARRRRYGAGAP